MKDHLIFDTTNASTIIDSDSVGAFVRSSDGTLITKHSISDSEKASLISQGLLFKSKLPGLVGNSYSFTVVDTGGAGPATFTEIGGAIIVDLVGLTPTRAAIASLLSTSTYADVSVGTPTGNVIVASIQSFSGGSDSSMHRHLDVYAALADGFNNPISSTDGAIDVNIASSDIQLQIDIKGIYDVSTNPIPDNVGVIAFDRAVTPGLSDQKFTPTGGLIGSVLSADLSKVHALDVNSFMYAADDVSGDMETLSKDATSNGLNVHIAGMDGTLTVSDAALANGAIVSNAEVLAVADTAQVAVASPLANRKYLSIYNMDNQKIFIGGSGVTAANGFPVSPGSYLEMRAGDSSAVYFVGSSAKTPEIRHLELA